MLPSPWLRGDNDYIILEEMRDAAAFKLAVDVTSIGTARSKATIHAGDAHDIPYKMASAISAKYGGDLKPLIARIFRSFNYVIEHLSATFGHGARKKT